MSIKGIDAQIMVTRTAELAKETSKHLKKNELMQEYMSVQTAELERQKKQMVTKTGKSDGLRLQPDRDSNGEKAFPQDQKKKEKSSSDISEDLKVAPDPKKHVIDIKI